MAENASCCCQRLCIDKPRPRAASLSHFFSFHSPGSVVEIINYLEKQGPQKTWGSVLKIHHFMHIFMFIAGKIKLATIVDALRASALVWAGDGHCQHVGPRNVKPPLCTNFSGASVWVLCSCYFHFYIVLSPQVGRERRTCRPVRRVLCSRVERYPTFGLPIHNLSLRTVAATDTGSGSAEPVQAHVAPCSYMLKPHCGGPQDVHKG